MHPTNSKPHCCPCPRVREWGMLWGGPVTHKNQLGSERGGLGHNIILLCRLPAQHLCFSSVLGHTTALELPMCPKWSCHVKKNTTVCPAQFWYCLCQGSDKYRCSKFYEGFANISLKGAQLFSFQTCFLVLQYYSLPGRHSVLPELSDTWARHWELPNCLSHTLISNVFNFCHPEPSVLFLTAYMYGTHFSSAFSESPPWALLHSLYTNLCMYILVWWWKLHKTNESLDIQELTDAWTAW